MIGDDEEPDHKLVKDDGKDTVVVVLAFGLAVALNIFIIGMVASLLFLGDQDAVPITSWQIISSTFGGLLGIIGSYVGFKIGRRERAEKDAASNNQPRTSKPD